MIPQTEEFEKFVKENFLPISVPAMMLKRIKVLEKAMKRIENAARKNDMEKVWKALR